MRWYVRHPFPSRGTINTVLIHVLGSGVLLLAHVCVALAAVGHTNDGVFFEWLVPVFFFVVPPHQFASLSDAVDDPATTPQWLEASYSEIVKAVNRHGSVPGALDALSLSAKGKVGARLSGCAHCRKPPLRVLSPCTARVYNGALALY